MQTRWNRFFAPLLLAAVFLIGPVATVSAAAGKEQPPGVQFKNLNVEQTEKALAQNKEIVVLDVRTPKEFAASRFPGAKNIDFYAKDFEKQIAALDKEKTYLVHCAVGGRSSKAVEKMKQQHFKSLLHLDGGMKAWEKAGKKVER